VNLGLIVEMARSAMPDRVALCDGNNDLTYTDLEALARSAAFVFNETGARSVAYVASNDATFPVALFGAALCGVPFVPLNYRLSRVQLERQIGGQSGVYAIVDTNVTESDFDGCVVAERKTFLERLHRRTNELDEWVDPEATALLLHTSGTSSEPKVAVLRHRHLMAYLIGTVEFATADTDEAALIAVPPYHIAGVANLLSNLYCGRRVVYLDQFDPERWLDLVRRQRITHAMVIPTMLARIVSHLETKGNAETPTLRSLSYGGARMPIPVLKRALELFPTTDFVNAYGLTETSSTVALLGPEDHRRGLQLGDAAALKRLESAGRILPGVELEIRDDAGRPLGTDESGLIFVRGEQVAGEYQDTSSLDSEGWFPTQDRGRIDEEGYLYIEGRSDDTIIRGGENIAPAEIEDVLLDHAQVAEAVVVGLPDEEWGQRLAAVVVLKDSRPQESDVSDSELREWVRGQLRSSKTPETIAFWDALPKTDTGKVIRRDVVTRLSS
jgi:acyl-CoA synthetase (AMP-forming)/AMP-acid ligase II